LLVPDLKSARVWKRTLDVVLSAVAIFVTAPVLSLAAVAIRLSAGPGSPLVRFSRLGEGAKQVSLIKLRTVPEQIDTSYVRRADGHLANRISRSVRAARLDQLPLLVNVLRGDLSLVGPAPVDERQIDWTHPVHRKVFTAKPGLTGLAQLAGLATDALDRNARPAAEISPKRLRLDSYYLDHQSLWLDLRILMRALASMIRSTATRLAARPLSRIARSMVTGFADGLGRLRGRHLFFLDVAATASTIYLVFALRSTAGLDGSLLATFLPAALLPLVVRPLINIGLGLYQRLWRDASVPELLVIVRAVATGTVVSVAVFYLVLVPLDFPGTASFPRSFWVIEGLLSLTLVAAPRLAIRATALSDAERHTESRPSRLRTLLYGAGSAGAMIARSAARESHAGVEPVGFLDDDRSHKGKRVAGLFVYGGAEAMVDAVTLTGAQVLLITMPAADGTAIRRVTKAGLDAGLEVRTVPPIHELFDGSVDAFRVRRVRVEDLIRRPEVARAGPEVEDIVRDRIVLVTGAGGSIGSELARQIFAMRPRRLILVDRGESALYSIQRELEAVAINGRGGGELDIHLANVASRAQMNRLIEAAGPDVILHAAANKHVPLMESHPSEAVQVNIGGTVAVLDAAIAAGTPTFVLVSTDKAVTPTSTMGATKRLAEWLVADAARRTGRAYVSVRFGNVLGSTGSVLPIFQGQLEQGQALTITHPEMTRYFMTIAEASSLILQAAAIGRPGDVLVLDMGDPIKILDLARDFVRLAGRDPDTVPMVFTGIRPGEKLHEQLFYDHESARLTANPKVMLAQGGSPHEEIRDLALELLRLADGGHEEDLRERLFAAVGTQTLSTAAPSDVVPASFETASRSKAFIESKKGVGIG
jgi:FlaA1/EpsC-like NDP-sugar epimerase/lipopolysaccharide/colanic/teichoic acid biosynthesis glycosyltransferase